MGLIFMKICPVCKKKFEDNANFCPHDGEVLEQDLTSLVGATLDGQYQIEALLGQGGMGAVYRARHILLGDFVAIKVMSAYLRSNPEYLRRFRREAQAARRFRHTNAVAVFDLRSTSDGLIYMVLEYVDGQTLRAELNRRRRFSPAEALSLLEPIANALNAAHVCGVVHRDLKPDNIMIGRSPDGQSVVKLLDLGLAKLQHTSDLSVSGEPSLTATGQILGTPYYMSPEQWGIPPDDGDPEIDGRTDIYSLGVIFYELVAGRRPFEGKTSHDLARAHMIVDPPVLHEVVSKVPVGFGLAIARAMSKRRSGRQSSCAELINDLRTALQIGMTKDEPSEIKQKMRSTSPSSAVTESQLAEITDAQSDLPTQKREVSINFTKETKLHHYEFSVVTLDPFGESTDRSPGHSEMFIEDLGQDIKIEMVLIAGGTFLMGSPDTEEKRANDEGPQHEVRVADFFMGRFEVTQAQWRAVAALPRINCSLNPDPSKFKGDDFPVERVSWDDCLKFCARLSRKTGRSYGLPSEAQWEYACRAGSNTPFHFGETINSALVNYDGNHPYGSGPKGIYRAQTTPVGSMSVANRFGLQDMHGNVWEWCADVWHENYEDAPADGSVWNVGGNSTLRVLRGGSWYSRGNGCRSALRYADRPDSRDDIIGFRVVLSQK
jgi:formylglycine-generating enzyme required for sulfatase activity